MKRAKGPNMSKWWLRSCVYWWFLRLALWLRCSLSAYPVIIIVMITSSTTSSSSWKCLKVNIRTTIVVASGSLFDHILIPPLQHPSSHLVKLMCQQAPFPSNQKNRLLGSLYISHLGSVLHFKEGYLHLDIYTGNPSNQGRKPDFHVGFPPRWA